jgi:peptide/nickel transport system permease protein
VTDVSERTRAFDPAWTLPALALLVLAVGVLLVPAIATRDPLRIEDVLARRLVAPFAHDARGDFHLLGTDRFGRDLFVRMMLAGRLSLLVGVLGAGLAGALGALLGAIAGWTGGVTDRLLMALADLLLAPASRR